MLSAAMSAAVCGKRSAFEEIFIPNSPIATPPITKRARRGGGSNSPVRFPSQHFVSEEVSAKLRVLRSMFPDMEEQILQRVLASCSNDIDSAIQSLHGLRLGVPESSSGSNPADIPSCDPAGAQQEQGTTPPPSGPSPTAQSRAVHDAGGWVEVVVREMMTAVDMQDARGKAGRVLEAFERDVVDRTTAAVVKAAETENGALKEQVQSLSRENMILKRAVAIQHERQREHEARATEVNELRQAVANHQEQLRKLEVSNYALNLHLKMAQDAGSMPNRFHPDVF